MQDEATIFQRCCFCRIGFMWYSAGPAVCWQWNLFFSRLMHLCEASQSLAGKSIKVLWSSGMLHQLLMTIPLKTNSLSLWTSWQYFQVEALSVSANKWWTIYSTSTYVLWVCSCCMNRIYSMSYCGEASQAERERQYAFRCLLSSDDLIHQRLSWCKHTWQDQCLTAGHYCTVLSWMCVVVSDSVAC